MNRSFKFVFVFCMLVSMSAFANGAPAQKSAPEVFLAKNGKALLPITISEKASDATKQLAQTLADYLQKISGAPFQVQTSGGENGIVLGTAQNFPSIKNTFNAGDLTQAEDYLIRTHNGGIDLIGATDKGVDHAVWDFLYRLGYRQFFPGEHWEIIPHQPDLSIAADVREHPDFLSRRIWPGYNTWPDNEKRWSHWNDANRMGAVTDISTGHAWGNIIRAEKSTFAEHPEYYALVGGKRAVKPEGKFDISNPGLRDLVVKYALDTFAAHPDQMTLSLEPSDGNGWDESPESAKLGSPSDQLVILANQVIDAVRQKYPDKYVAFYAYGQHSPPPTVKLHPGIIVNVATAFISGGYSFEQLVQGWRQAGAEIGVREYFSVFTWDHDLPHHAKAAQLESLPARLAHYHQLGASYITAESSDNWGPNGLGYYIASRIMWNADNANHVDAIVTDFLDKSFGGASGPMRHFYEMINGIDGKAVPPFSEDYIGRLYRTLDEAEKATNDAGALARIGDLALYVRYLELYNNYTEAGDKTLRQQYFSQLVPFVYRIHPTHMVHSIAIYREHFRDKSVTIPAEAEWRVSEGKNPWKSSQPFTQDDIQKIISDGITNNKLREFESKTYSDDLVKTDALHLQVPPRLATRTKMGYLRGNNDLLIWLDGPVTVQAMAGTIYADRGPAQLSLHEQGEAVEDDTDADAPVAPPPLQSFDVPPDKQWHDYILKAPHPGIYVLRLADKGMGSDLEWPQTTPVTVESTLEKPWELRVRGALYFYVPKGTKTLGGFAKGSYHLYEADGKVLLSDQDGYFNIPVATGQDGKLWQFGFASGSVVLLTVPSYLARSPQELMLPREVVAADK